MERDDEAERTEEGRRPPGRMDGGRVDGDQQIELLVGVRSGTGQRLERRDLGERDLAP